MTGSTTDVKYAVDRLYRECSCRLLIHTFLIVVFYTHYFRVNKLWGFVTFLVIDIFLCAMDGLVSNGFGHNIKTIRKAGYSDVTILFFMEFNRLASQLIAYFLVNYVATDDRVYTFQCLLGHLDVRTISKVAINLALSEVLFTFGHSLMHKNASLMKLHIFHHCCTQPTWNTNLLFHPLDLTIEFTAPALGLFAMHFFLWNDEAVLVYTYIIFQLWYAFDHDEDMQSYHTQHHIHCDSLYVIYCNLRGAPAKNLLKQYMNDQCLLGKQPTTYQRSTTDSNSKKLWF